MCYTSTARCEIAQMWYYCSCSERDGTCSVNVNNSKSIIIVNRCTCVLLVFCLYSKTNTLLMLNFICHEWCQVQPSQNIFREQVIRKVETVWCYRHPRPSECPKDASF